MICSHCGQEIPDNSKFCPKCGQAPAPEGAEAPAAEGPAAPVNMEGPKAEAPKAPAAKLPTGGGGGLIKIVVPAVIALIVVIVIIAKIAGGKKSVDLSKYVNIEVDGYNTIGTASYSLDYDKFEEDYGDKFKITTKAVKKAAKTDEEVAAMVTWYGGASEVVKALEGTDLTSSVLGEFSGELSVTEGLSNGDEVVFTPDDITDDEEFAQMTALLGYEFTAKEVSTTVADLPEIETFDPFDGMQIEFTGTAPNGTAQITSSGSNDACYDLTYTVEPRNGLSNGDTVKVTVTYPYGDMYTEMADSYGRVPGETTKEFTVSGLTSYVSSSAEIPDEGMALIKSQADDVLAASLVDNVSDDTEELVNTTYLGTYFMAAKSGMSPRYENQLYLVYKVRVHDFYTNDDGDSYDANNDYYWYVRFTDILVTDTGECSVNLANFRSVADDGKTIKIQTNVSKGWGTQGWQYYGYDSLDMMYNQLVTVNIDKFKAENNVTDISFDAGTTVEASAEETTEETAEESTEATTEEVTE